MARKKHKKHFDMSDCPVEMLSAREILGDEVFEEIKKIEKYGDLMLKYLESLAEAAGFSEGARKIIDTSKCSVNKWRKNYRLFDSACLEIRTYYHKPLYLQTYKESFSPENFAQRKFIMENQPWNMGDPSFEALDIDFTSSEAPSQLLNFLAGVSQSKSLNLAKTGLVLLQDTFFKLAQIEAQKAVEDEGVYEETVLTSEEFENALTVIKGRTSEDIEAEVHNGHLNNTVREKRKEVTQKIEDINEVIGEEAKSIKRAKEGKK